MNRQREGSYDYYGDDNDDGERSGSMRGRQAEGKAGGVKFSEMEGGVDDPMDSYTNDGDDGKIDDDADYGGIGEGVSGRLPVWNNSRLSNRKRRERRDDCRRRRRPISPTPASSSPSSSSSSSSLSAKASPEDRTACQTACLSWSSEGGGAQPGGHRGGSPLRMEKNVADDIPRTGMSSKAGAVGSNFRFVSRKSVSVDDDVHADDHADSHFDENVGISESWNFGNFAGDERRQRSRTKGNSSDNWSTRRIDHQGQDEVQQMLSAVADALRQKSETSLDDNNDDNNNNDRTDDGNDDDDRRLPALLGAGGPTGGGAAAGGGSLRSEDGRDKGGSCRQHGPTFDDEQQREGSVVNSTAAAGNVAEGHATGGDVEECDDSSRGESEFERGGIGTGNRHVNPVEDDARLSPGRQRRLQKRLLVAGVQSRRRENALTASERDTGSSNDDDDSLLLVIPGGGDGRRRPPLYGESTAAGSSAVLSPNGELLLTTTASGSSHVRGICRMTGGDKLEKLGVDDEDAMHDDRIDDRTGDDDDVGEDIIIAKRRADRRVRSVTIRGPGDRDESCQCNPAKAQIPREDGGGDHDDANDKDHVNDDDDDVGDDCNDGGKREGGGGGEPCGCCSGRRVERLDGFPLRFNCEQLESAFGSHLMTQISSRVVAVGLVLLFVSVILDIPSWLEDSHDKPLLSAVILTDAVELTAQLVYTVCGACPVFHGVLELTIVITTSIIYFDVAARRIFVLFYLRKIYTNALIVSKIPSFLFRVLVYLLFLNFVFVVRTRKSLVVHIVGIFLTLAQAVCFSAANIRGGIQLATHIGIWVYSMVGVIAILCFYFSAYMAEQNTRRIFYQCWQAREKLHALEACFEHNTAEGASILESLTGYLQEIRGLTEAMTDFTYEVPEEIQFAIERLNNLGKLSMQAATSNLILDFGLGARRMAARPEVESIPWLPFSQPLVADATAEQSSYGEVLTRGRRPSEHAVDIHDTDRDYQQLLAGHGGGDQRGLMPRNAAAVASHRREAVLVMPPVPRGSFHRRRRKSTGGAEQQSPTTAVGNQHLHNHPHHRSHHCHHQQHRRRTRSSPVVGQLESGSAVLEDQAALPDDQSSLPMHSERESRTAQPFQTATAAYIPHHHRQYSDSQPPHAQQLHRHHHLHHHHHSAGRPSLSKPGSTFPSSSQATAPIASTPNWLSPSPSPFPSPAGDGGLQLRLPLSALSTSAVHSTRRQPFSSRTPSPSPPTSFRNAEQGVSAAASVTSPLHPSTAASGAAVGYWKTAQQVPHGSSPYPPLVAALDVGTSFGDSRANDGYTRPLARLQLPGGNVEGHALAVGVSRDHRMVTPTTKTTAGWAATAESDLCGRPSAVSGPTTPAPGVGLCKSRGAQGGSVRSGETADNSTWLMDERGAGVPIKAVGTTSPARPSRLSPHGRATEGNPVLSPGSADRSSGSPTPHTHRSSSSAVRVAASSAGGIFAGKFRSAAARTRAAAAAVGSRRRRENAPSAMPLSTAATSASGEYDGNMAAGAHGDCTVCGAPRGSRGDGEMHAIRSARTSNSQDARCVNCRHVLSPRSGGKGVTGGGGELPLALSLTSSSASSSAGAAVGERCGCAACCQAVDSDGGGPPVVLLNSWQALVEEGLLLPDNEDQAFVVSNIGVQYSLDVFALERVTQGNALLQVGRALLAPRLLAPSCSSTTLSSTKKLQPSRIKSHFLAPPRSPDSTSSSSSPSSPRTTEPSRAGGAAASPSSFSAVVLHRAGSSRTAALADRLRRRPPPLTTDRDPTSSSPREALRRHYHIQQQKHWRKDVGALRKSASSVAAGCGGGSNSTLQCLPGVLLNFLARLQALYFRRNSYHNSSHAALVAHIGHWMCKSLKLFDCHQLSTSQLKNATLAATTLGGGGRDHSNSHPVSVGKRLLGGTGSRATAASNSQTQCASPLPQLPERRQLAIEEAAFIIAALGHDAGHPGRNNLFFVHANEPLALVYNDLSVLENYHAYLTFKVLTTVNTEGTPWNLPEVVTKDRTGSMRAARDARPSNAASSSDDDDADDGTWRGTPCEGENVQPQRGSGECEYVIGDIYGTGNGSANILGATSVAEFRTARKAIIEWILGTDMSQHFAKLSAFRVRKASPEFSPMTNAEDRALTASLCLKAADIGHATLDWLQHHAWCLRVVEEFYSQGDEETVRGLVVSPLCDRAKHGELAKAQCGFVEYVVLPLVTEVESVFVSLQQEFLRHRRSQQATSAARSRLRGLSAGRQNSSSSSGVIVVQEEEDEEVGSPVWQSDSPLSAPSPSAAVRASVNPNSKTVTPLMGVVVVDDNSSGGNPISREVVSRAQQNLSLWRRRAEEAARTATPNLAPQPAAVT